MSTESKKFVLVIFSIVSLTLNVHSEEQKSVPASGVSTKGSSPSSKAINPIKQQIKADAEANQKTRRDAEKMRINARIEILKAEINQEIKTTEMEMVPDSSEKGAVFISNEKSPTEKNEGG